MKTVRIPSRLLALFLALSLAYSLTALPALSEEGAEIGSVTVEISSDNSEPAVIAGGEAIGETDGEGNPVGFTVETSAEEPPAVTVVIDQSAVQEGEDASNVGVFMPKGSSVTVEAEGVNIVSEETGSISVAIDGMIKRNLTNETFEKILRNELMESEETKIKKRGSFIFRNSGDKQ